MASLLISLLKLLLAICGISTSMLLFLAAVKAALGTGRPDLKSIMALVAVFAFAFAVYSVIL
ncbi:MAG: hypothetical protein QXT43_00905 [Candidatus Micrarchaeaceae archaeon]